MSNASNNQSCPPTQQTILTVLGRLNQAYRAYNPSLPSHMRVQLTTTFYQHYRWLLSWRIPFRFDQVQRCYLPLASLYNSMSGAY
ncbi:hypothetical protein EPA93_06985 [Ktedonosporobacter rubrisoli]|uniref:Uncharacterized protein n=1 Tax=Ktedonosporobacter rubrisoli TaxID=2509675 RepID=A0A4P6JL93_KTERU|nr:hypothetical protein [Ktedonosporobacter rubrisoli]QBD75762.1 hypothetical protein EPA93_06985 [Ktedonosporobacter rubrisoli]